VPGEGSVPEIDTSTPSVARMYDYYLGGKDNYQVDREAADRVRAAVPEVGDLALENRAFLRRAVRFLVRRGVRQFLDIGSGLPTAGNTHEIAQEIVPDARVVYVDNDPVVLTHGRALLATNEHTTVVQADLRRPGELVERAKATGLVDFDEPVGVLMMAIMHFLAEDERDAIMGGLRDALAPGSHLAASHVTAQGRPAEAAKQVEAVYAATPTPLYFRDRDDIAPFFAGFELYEPGLVTLDEWNPDNDPVDPSAGDVGKWGFCAVGRKP